MIVQNERMTTLTLEIANSEDLEIILQMAKRLNCKVVDKKVQKNKKTKTAEILKLFKEISETGEVKKLIPNPKKWQKQIRKDRKLYL